MGQDQERPLKFIKARFNTEDMSVADRGHEIINTRASGRHAQRKSPRPKQGHCLLTWARQGGFMSIQTSRPALRETYNETFMTTTFKGLVYNI